MPKERHPQKSHHKNIPFLFAGSSAFNTNNRALQADTGASPDLLEILWLVAIFFLPLFFWPNVYTTFELPKIVLFHGITIAMVLVWIFRLCWPNVPHMPHLRATDTAHARAPKDAPFSIPSIMEIRVPLILLALVIATWIIGTIFSVAPAISFYGYYPRFQGLYAWIFYILFAGIVFLNINNRRQIERVFAAISASALVTGVIAFLQSFGFSVLNFWDSSAFLGRLFGTMGHPDFLAGFLILAIPLSVYLILSNRFAIMSLLSLAVSLSALFFTLSRAAFIGLFAGLMFFLLVYSIKTKAGKLFWTIIIAPVVIAVIVIFANLNAQNDIVRGNTLLNRMVFSGENLRSVQTRLALWPATINQIMARPLSGYGLDTYAISFPQFYPTEINKLENLGDYPDRAHNFILDYAVQLGIPALIFFLGFLFYVFQKGMRFVFKNNNDWLLPLTLSSSLIAILTANFFGFFVTVTWVYFWLLTAIFISCTTKAKQTVKVPAAILRVAFRRKMKILFFILLFMGVIIFYLNDYRLFRADLTYRKAYDGDFAMAEKAANMAPKISFYWYQAAKFSLTRALNTADQKTPDQDEKFQLLLKANAEIEKAGALTAYDGKYFLLKAQILNALKNSGAAVFFQKAIGLMPANPSAYLEYGKVLYEAGDYSNSVTILEKYLSLCPDYYKWKKDLASRSPEEHDRYRIFYKLNPDFNKVFVPLADSYAKTGNDKKAAEYLQYSGN
jgi:O-antigen ligase